MSDSHVVEHAGEVGAHRGIGSTDGRTSWAVHVVIPARGALGGTRLPAPPGVAHCRLARAMAQDTVVAALGAASVQEVVVVTGDDTLAAWARGQDQPAAIDPAESTGRDRPRCRVVADPETGLSGAIAAGLAALPPSALAAVLLGDLAALTAPDLEAAFAAAARSGPAQPAYVPDAEGDGTVLLIGEAARLRPAFGADSAARHARHAVRLDLDLPRLRRDVDDAADLAAAERLGLGAQTRAALDGPAESPTG